MDQEDPLQVFLRSTGWSPDQLLQKLQNIKNTTNVAEKPKPVENQCKEENGKGTLPDVVNVAQNNNRNDVGDRAADVQCTTDDEGSSIATINDTNIIPRIEKCYSGRSVNIEVPDSIVTSVNEDVFHIDLTEDFDSPVKIVKVKSTEDRNEVEDDTSCTEEKIVEYPVNQDGIKKERSFIGEGFIPSEDEEEGSVSTFMRNRIQQITEVVKGKDEEKGYAIKEGLTNIQLTTEDTDIIILSDEDDNIESVNNTEKENPKEETKQSVLEDPQQSSPGGNVTDEPKDEVIFKKPLTLPKKDKNDETKPTENVITEDLHDILRMQLNCLRTKKKKGIFLEEMKKPSTMETVKISKKVTTTKVAQENKFEKVEKKQDDLYTQTNELGLVIMDVQGGIDIEENNTKVDNKEETSNNKDDNSNVVSEIRKIITKQRARNEEKNMTEEKNTTEEKNITNFEFFKNTPQKSTQESDANVIIKTPEKSTENIPSTENSQSFLSVEDSVEKNSPFVSNILDEFLNENAKLNISYKVPKLGAEDTLKNNSFELDTSPLILKKAVDIKEDMKRTEQLKMKPKTLAQKRKLLEKQKMKEEVKRRKMEKDSRNSAQEENRNYILFKGKRIFVRTHSENSNKCVFEVKKQKKMGGKKKPSLLAEVKKSSIKYLAGPLCKKEHLQVDDNIHWQAEVKCLPKIFLEVTPAVGKPIEPDILKFLPHYKGKMDESQVAFALSALYDRNKPITEKELKTFRFSLRYQNNQQQIVVKRPKVSSPEDEKVEDVKKIEEFDKESEGENDIKYILDDLIRYVELKAIESTLIKEDDTCIATEDTLETIAPTTDVSSTIIKKPTKRKSRVDYELLRLNCKVVNVEVEEEEQVDCSKPYCKLGCVCKSLKCDNMISYHCRKVGCMFECTCPKERTVTYDHTMTLPAGTNILSKDAVYRIEDEAKRDLARVEREFTQTVIHANDKTIVVGLGTRRAAKIRRTVAKTEATKNMFNQRCIVSLQKHNFEDIMPYCMVHNLHDCECEGTAVVPPEDEPLPQTYPKKRKYRTWSSVSDNHSPRPSRTIRKPAKLASQSGNPYKSARTKSIPYKYSQKLHAVEKGDRRDSADVEGDSDDSGTSKTDHQPKNKRKQVIEVRNDADITDTSSDTNREPQVKATWVNHNEVAFDSDTTKQRQKAPVPEVQLDDVINSSETIQKKKRTASWVDSIVRKRKKKPIGLNSDQSPIKTSDMNIQTNVTPVNEVRIEEAPITLSSILDRKTTSPWENDRPLIDIDRIIQRRKKPVTTVRKKLKGPINLNGAIQRRKKLIKTIRVVQPVFTDEIIVDKSNMELLSKMGPKTVADGYARLLPWRSLVKDFHRGVVNIWCNKHFPTKLQMNLAKCKNPPPENYVPIRIAKNPTQIILWICCGKLPNSYDEKNVSFILKDTKTHFEICGLCSKNTPDIPDDQSLADGSPDIVDFVHNDINDGIQVLELKMDTFKLQELIEKGLEAFGDTSIDSTKLYMWAALPEINSAFMWRVIFLKNNFTYLNFKKMKYTIGYGDLVKAGLLAKNKSCTVVLKNFHMKTYYSHKKFGLYFDPLYQDRFFIGPYFVCADNNDVETLITTGLNVTQKCDSACGQWLVERPYAKKGLESNEATIDLTQDADETGEDIHVVTEKSKPSQILMHNGEKIFVMDSTPRRPEEFNRYIVSNIPHFGYIGAYQHSNSQEIDVQWPFENKLLRFNNVKCAVEFLQYRFSHLLVPVPKTFEIQIVVLQELDTEKHQPVNSNILNGHYICGDFGYYSFITLTDELCRSKVGVSKEEILRCFLLRARNMVKERLDYLATTLNVEPTNPQRFEEADYIRILNTATLEITKQKTLKQNLMYEKLKLMKEKRSKAKRVFNMISCLPQEERKIESMKFWNTMKKLKTNDEPIEITDSEDEEKSPSTSSQMNSASAMKSILKPLRSVSLTEGKSVLMRGDSIIQQESQQQEQSSPSAASPSPPPPLPPLVALPPPPPPLAAAPKPPPSSAVPPKPPPSSAAPLPHPPSSTAPPTQDSKQKSSAITLPSGSSNNYVKGVKLVKNSLGKLLLVTDSNFAPMPVTNKLTTGTKIMIKNNKILSLCGKKDTEPAKNGKKTEAISKNPEVVDEVLVDPPIELDDSEDPIVI